MAVKKAVIEGIIYDVVERDRCITNNEYGSRLAIEFRGHIYPLRTFTDTRPGLYNISGVTFVKEVSNQYESDMYSIANLIDFSNIQDIQDVINKTNTLKQMERELLTSTDNIYNPIVRVNDAPLMVALKTALKEKHIELEKYESRFEGNFSNDKRLLDKDSITIKKLMRMFDIFDLTGEIIIRDKPGDIPNPIGRDIKINLGGECNPNE